MITVAKTATYLYISLESFSQITSLGEHLS